MSPVITVFVIAVAACAVAHVAIFASVVRRATGVADSSVPRPNFIAEVVWALIPALVLALVLTATWVKVRERAVSDPGAVLKIAR